MAVYRSKLIEPNTIAMIPVHGYVNRTNYSPDSIRWMDFVSHDQGVQIDHALSNRGEIKIGGVSVDGFCRQTNTIYQYHVSIIIIFKIEFKFLKNSLPLFIF